MCPGSLKPYQLTLFSTEKDFIPSKKHSSPLHVYFTFLAKPSFLLVALSTMFAGAAIFIYGAYVPEYASIAIPEVTSTEVAILVCAMGANSFLGKILFGSLSMTSPNAPLLLHALSLALCGVSDILVPFCPTYLTHVSNSTIQGMFLGETVV